MKNLIQTSVFAFLLFFFSGIVLPAAPTDDLKPVFTLDAGNPASAGIAKEILPEIYEFPAGAVGTGVTNRKTFFADALIFRLTGADPQAKYAVRATFLSDAERTLEFKSTDEIVEDGIELSAGKILAKNWLLPASSYTQTQGVLVLQFHVTAGPNAVIQKLEIFSDNSKALALEANPPKKPFVLDVAQLDTIANAVGFPQNTPRPTGVTGVANPILSLNGTWQFSPDGTAAGANSKTIQVPGEWAMQGFDVPKRAFAEYYRTFNVPADWAEKTVRLRFDAVHAVCKVFVNGKEIGGHEGGFVPFELDATGAVKPGAQNEIRVQVQSESIADSVACMSQYAAHQVGGIVRKVTLFAVPAVYISEQNWTVKFDKGFNDATLEIATDLDGMKKDSGADIRHELIDSAGNVVAAWGNLGGISAAKTTVVTKIIKKPVRNSAGEISINDIEERSGYFPQQFVTSSATIKSPKHWTPETPNLYTLKTTLLVDGNAAETITQRIGFRQVEIKGNIFLVNGKPVKLLGVCRHEVHPLRGRSLTPELCRQDALLFREGNCNFIRTSHYPPSEEFLDACDELGLFVESESAITWIKHGASPVWKTWNHLDPKYFPYFLRANLDNVAANRNHPSIVMWSIANESLWTPLFAKVLEIVKKVDSTRAVNFHDQCWGGFNNAGSTAASMANYHYPSENNSDSWSKESRPVIFGEYVHLQCYNRRELVTDPFIREDWGRPTARMVDLMWEQPGLAGGSIWSGIDDVFHMPNGELRGYGHWGPIDGWRRKKPEWYGMKKAYTPVKFFDADKVQKIENGVVKLRIQNRFNFTNLKDVKIEWKTKNTTGAIVADIAPHAKGEIKIPVGKLSLNDKLEITVTDPRGFVCETESLRFKDADTRPLIGLPRDSVPALGETPETFTVSVAKYVYEIDRKTGALTTRLNGTAIATTPITPMILPLTNEGGAYGPAGSMLTNKIEPFTPVSENWIPTSITGTTADGKVIVKIDGTGDDADGTITLNFLWNRIEVGYAFTLKKDINPRQWGLVFTLPRSFDTLAWNGRGIWTTAPADSIGRPVGFAKANPVVRDVVEELGKDLSGTDWSQDANALGTNDFRSTKANIYTAGLNNDTGTFSVKSDGTASVRAWVDNDSVKFLVAGFNTGGFDGFFGMHYATERRPLKSGDKVEGRFEITIK